jgi:hypothetical protein
VGQGELGDGPDVEGVENASGIPLKTGGDGNSHHDVNQSGGDYDGQWEFRDLYPGIPGSGVSQVSIELIVVDGPEGDRLLELQSRAVRRVLARLLHGRDVDGSVDDARTGRPSE